VEGYQGTPLGPSACQSCGQVNGAGASFCTSCGSGLGAAPSAEGPTGYPPGPTYPQASFASTPVPGVVGPGPGTPIYQAPYQTPTRPEYAYYAPVQAGPGTNGMAIASLILGVLWLYWFGSILALIFGYVALHQIKERNEGGRGMAIAGTVLGWIGVATGLLVVILVAIAARHASTPPYPY